MQIVLADDGVAFDGRTPAERPLGGAQQAFVSLAAALAAEGAEVLAYTRGARALSEAGVVWRSLEQGLPERTDFYIGNRAPHLIGAVPARHQAFWLHNPATFLKKPRYWLRLERRRPVTIFIGQSHRATAPGWALFGGAAVIPYGANAPVLAAPDIPAPPRPRAVFTSNPMRGLDWLLEVWRDHIHPRLPEAELHLYSGAAVYGAAAAKWRDQAESLLAEARAMEPLGVRAHAPLPHAQLINALRGMRVMLYRGDLGETYCQAVGDAQALGLPAVSQPIASMPERIIDGETGFLRSDPAAFAEAAIQIMTDDVLWSRFGAAARIRARNWTWRDAARAVLDLAA